LASASFVIELSPLMSIVPALLIAPPVSATPTAQQPRAFPPYPPRTHQKQLVFKAKMLQAGAVVAASTCGSR
jgi:hypothetical protein